jgi:DMSO reductase anchor subunit
VNPAWSVIFFTVLTGSGQGLYASSLFLIWKLNIDLSDAADWQLWAIFCIIVAGFFTLLGLGASFFHLGHPMRAWRAVTMWKTSWLSREVIILPVFLFFLAVSAAIVILLPEYFYYVGTATVGISLILFICTAMIYESLKFLQEWATPLTFLNFFIQGSASGTTLCTTIAAYIFDKIFSELLILNLALLLFGLAIRLTMLRRNKLLRSQSTLQTAIGVKHPKIELKSQGFSGTSFNHKEFMNRSSKATLRRTKFFFLIFSFILPAIFLIFSTLSYFSLYLIAFAFLTQFIGLLAERWYFFAEAKHPQNLYYEALS